MKVLVTGASGQLGRALSGSVPPGVEAIALDRAHCDLADAGSCRAAVRAHVPDVVINAAAYTQVDRAEVERELAFRINAEAPRELAEAARETGGRLIHLSTDFVFDGTRGTPWPPDAPCAPLNAYGASKRAGEEAVLAALGEQACVLRTAWVYSRHGSNFVRTMLRLVASRDEVSVVSDQIGSPTWANSVARAAWSAAMNPQARGILHWTDAGVASWYDFAVAIQEEALTRGLLDRAVPIRPITAAEYRQQFPASVPRPAFSVLDTASTRRLLGISPSHWRTALRSMLDELAA